MGTTKKVIVATGKKFTLKRIETRGLNKRDIDRNLRNLITYSLAAREKGHLIGHQTQLSEEQQC